MRGDEKGQKDKAKSWFFFQAFANGLPIACRPFANSPPLNLNLSLSPCPAFLKPSSSRRPESQIAVFAICANRLVVSPRGGAAPGLRRDGRSVDFGFSFVTVAVEININTKVKTKVNTPPPASPELSDTPKTKSIVLAPCLSEREPLKGESKHSAKSLFSGEL